MPSGPQASFPFACHCRGLWTSAAVSSQHSHRCLSQNWRHANFSLLAQQNGTCSPGTCWRGSGETSREKLSWKQVTCAHFLMGICVVMETASPNSFPPHTSLLQPKTQVRRVCSVWLEKDSFNESHRSDALSRGDPLSASSSPRDPERRRTGLEKRRSIKVPQRWR